MPRLTLLRHAQASEAPPGGRDFDRPLSAQGRAAARELGGRIAASLPSPQRLLVSPAVRTRETSDLVCAAAWPTLVTIPANTLYLASLEMLLHEIASTPADCPHLMLVGHNPGLSELWSLIGGEAGFVGLATTGWRSREFDVHSWVSVAALR